MIYRITVCLTITSACKTFVYYGHQLNFWSTKNTYFLENRLQSKFIQQWFRLTPSLIWFMAIFPCIVIGNSEWPLGAYLQFVVWCFQIVRGSNLFRFCMKVGFCRFRAGSGPHAIVILNFITWFIFTVTFFPPLLNRERENSQTSANSILICPYFNPFDLIIRTKRVIHIIYYYCSFPMNYYPMFKC